VAKLKEMQTGFKEAIIRSIAVGGKEGSWKIFLTYHVNFKLL